MHPWEPSLGATVQEGGTRFCLWAPEAQSVEIVVKTKARQGEVHAMTRGADGFFLAMLPHIGDGDLYRYRLDARGAFPDPASRFQPQGVAGAIAGCGLARFSHGRTPDGQGGSHGAHRPLRIARRNLHACRHVRGGLPKGFPT